MTLGVVKDSPYFCVLTNLQPQDVGGTQDREGEKEIPIDNLKVNH